MATSYSNAGGSGNRTGIITASYSGITGGCGSDYAVPLIDGSKAAGSCTTSAAWGVSNPSAVLKFDFRTTKIIDEFKWFQDDTSNHGTWSFAGSNNDSTYTDLTTGITLGGATTSTYSFSNTTPYRYYKLYKTGGAATSSTPWLEEIEFKIAEGDPTKPSYDNTGGRGDRHLIITSSDSGLTGGCGTPYAAGLVDGSFVSGCSTAAAWGTGNSASGILTWDFGVGVSKIIDEFCWYQDVNATHGTWKFSGSNDNSSYTDLATGITLGVTNSHKAAGFAVSNTTGFRYYRLTHTGADNTSGVPWNHEIEFRIANGEVDLVAAPVLGVNAAVVLTTDNFATVAASLGFNVAVTVRAQRAGTVLVVCT